MKKPYGWGPAAPQRLHLPGRGWSAAQPRRSRLTHPACPAPWPQGRPLARSRRRKKPVLPLQEWCPRLVSLNCAFSLSSCFLYRGACVNSIHGNEEASAFIGLAINEGHEVSLSKGMPWLKSSVFGRWHRRTEPTAQPRKKLRAGRV